MIKGETPQALNELHLKGVMGHSLEDKDRRRYRLGYESQILNQPLLNGLCVPDVYFIMQNHPEP